MLYTSSLVLAEPYSSRVTTTASHPQLRDLLAYTPTSHPQSNSIATATYDSLAHHSLYNDRRPVFTPLAFSPCCIAQGCGFVVAGGQNSEIALKSVESDQQDWCYQHVPHSIASAASPLGSIVNSLNVSPSPTHRDRPRLLACSNDHVIKVFDIVPRGDGGGGDDNDDELNSQTGYVHHSRDRRPRGIPDWYGAKRFRQRRRNVSGWSVVESTWRDGSDRRDEDEAREDDQVEEAPSYDVGSSCRLVARPELDIKRLSTPINHCSISPDGRHLVAVGDTDEVFLFDANLATGEYVLRQTLRGGGGSGDGIRRDASFSSDWDADSHSFVVGSQDGFVSVYDERQLGPSSASATSYRSDRTLATLSTTQRGPAGAVRKVKFSPGGRGNLDGGLLAFTEHRNKVHVVDTRNGYRQSQILEIPRSCSTIASPPPSSSFSTPRSPWEALRVPPGISSAWGEDEQGEFPLRNRPLPSPTLARRETTTPARARSGAQQQRETTDRDGSTIGRHWRPRESAGGPVYVRTHLTRSSAAPIAMDLPDEGGGQVWPTLSAPLPREPQGNRSDPNREEDDEDEGEDEGSEGERGEDSDEEGPGEEPDRPEADELRHFVESVHRLEDDARVRQTYSSVAASLSLPSPSSRNASTPRSSHANVPYSTLTRYSTTTTTSGTNFGSSVSLFAAPLLAGAPRPSTPSSSSTAASTSAATASLGTVHPFALPTYSYRPTPGVGIELEQGTTTTTYYPHHYHHQNNFPTDSSPYDVLGMDWDEFGERLLVSTAQRVWEWDVDTKSRRGTGVYDFV